MNLLRLSYPHLNYSRRRTSSPTWKLAWGQVAALTETIWRDGQMAIVQPQNTSASPSGAPVVLSPSQRFVLIGEVWLSDRQPLAKFEQVNANAFEADLQLIAAAWEHWGVDTFTHLIGEFGLAVWDREQQKLWLGRDRTGARTLYYTPSCTTVSPIRWVAPHLRSLIAHHARLLDEVALRDYLCCAFVPGNRTLWQQVRELRPGTVVSFPGEQMQTYWQLQKGEPNSVLEPGDEPTLEWHGQRLRTQLEQVVQDCLPQREPVGVFLSGGLDSSSVTALAAQFHKM